jgi:1-acyl-sn-glycerol-3-phosphate acyltransferase
MKLTKEEKFNFTWFIPKAKKERLINYVMKTPREVLCTKVKDLTEKWFKFEVVGLENIPENGKAVIAMNHRSMFDPVILVNIPRDVFFVAGSKLWTDPIFAPVLDKFNCIKVNKKDPAISFFREVKRRLKEQDIVGIYPEGTRNGLRKGKPPEDGVGYFAYNKASKTSEAPVIPVYIYYKYKIFGLLIPHVTKVKAVIGNPFMLDQVDGSGQVAMDHILALEEQAKQLVKRKRC